MRHYVVLFIPLVFPRFIFYRMCCIFGTLEEVAILLFFPLLFSHFGVFDVDHPLCSLSHLLPLVTYHFLPPLLPFPLLYFLLPLFVFFFSFSSSPFPRCSCAGEGVVPPPCRVVTPPLRSLCIFPLSLPLLFSPLSPFFRSFICFVDFYFIISCKYVSLCLLLLLCCSPPPPPVIWSFIGIYSFSSCSL